MREFYREGGVWSWRIVDLDAELRAVNRVCPQWRVLPSTDWPSTRLVGVCCAVVCVIAGCSQEPQGQGPGKREQVLAVRPAEEIEIGRQAFQKIREQVTVIDSGPEVEQVQRVSQRIAKAIEIEPLQREINLHIADYPFEWEYIVIEDNQINAFCLPGGKVVVLSGLMRLVKNDDQLATVIAHEIAHVLAHHANERIARERTVHNGLLSLAYNREQESEADHIGVFLMTFADYDPDQAIAFWQEMESARGAGIRLPEILSDHPKDSRRMRQLQTWISNAKAAKEAYVSGRILQP